MSQQDKYRRRLRAAQDAVSEVYFGAFCARDLAMCWTVAAYNTTAKNHIILYKSYSKITAWEGAARRAKSDKLVFALNP